MNKLFSWRRIAPWISFFLLIISFVIPTGVFVWLTFFTDTFLVHAITVIDARPHTTQAVKDIMSQKLEKNQKNNKTAHIFFINTHTLEEALMQAIPRIHSVHIVKELPSTVKVIIQEKKPKILMLASGHYYFVDEDGIVYEEAELQNLPGVVLPTIKNKQSDATITLGTPVVNKAFVSFVYAITEKLPEIVKADIVDIHIPSFATREVTFRLNNNWEIRFDTTRDPKQQLAVLNQLLSSTVTPQEKAVLEYIDLRIPNRVYYKTR